MAVIAYDFTVMAGSMGRTAETKCNRARELAYTRRMPMIWLIDSAGARLQEAIGSRWFAGAGQLFREESIFSGAMPAWVACRPISVKVSLSNSRSTRSRTVSLWQCLTGDVLLTSARAG